MVEVSFSTANPDPEGFKHPDQFAPGSFAKPAFGVWSEKSHVFGRAAGPNGVQILSHEFVRRTKDVELNFEADIGASKNFDGVLRQRVRSEPC